jgi:hypothetical protein
MGSHTPGPWKVELYGSVPHVLSGHIIIARCDYSGVKQNEDAQLIAAAPELLDALKKATEVLKHASPFFDLKLCPDFHRTLHNAKTLIAKVEGKK